MYGAVGNTGGKIFQRGPRVPNQPVERFQEEFAGIKVTQHFLVPNFAPSPISQFEGKTIVRKHEKRDET